MAVLDTLDIKISANAMNAAKALDQLANSMKRVRAALLNTKDGVSVGDQLAKSIHELNNAMNRINTGGINKLNQLSSALHKFAAAAKKVQGIKINSSLAKSVKNAQAALATQAGTATSPSGSANTNDPADNVKKVGKEVEKAGKKAKKASSAFGNLFASIKRIAMYRAIRAAMKAVAEAFSEGTKNAYAYSKQSENFKELAEVLDHVKTVTFQMTNQIGAFWGEIKQFVAPVIEWLVEKVRTLAEKLSEFFAALNGKATYLRAKQVAQSWDDAADSVKKFKQQLLGLDELNNLTSKQSGKDTTDPKDMYEEVAVGADAQKLAEGYDTLKQKLEHLFDDYHNVFLAGIGLLTIGAIFTFFTTKKLFGLGLMLASGLLIGKSITESDGAILGEIQQKMEQYRWLFAAGSIGLTAIGAALLFTHHWKLGLGCVLAGVAIGATTVAMNWELMYDDIEHAMQEYRWLFAAGAIGLTVIGAGLLFTGHYALGLSCVLAGVAIGATDLMMNWEQMYDDIEHAMQDYRALFMLGAIGLTAIGAALIFSAHYALGLGCVLGGVALGASEIIMSWDLMKADIEHAMEEYPGLFAASAIGLAVIGAALIFTQHYALGIGCIMSGVALGAYEIAMNWDELHQTITNAFEQYRDIFAITGTAMAVIGLLLLATGHIGLGLGILVAGSYLDYKAIEVNWDSIFEGIKGQWNKITSWWNSHVKGNINKAANWIEETFHIDLNGDGQYGGLRTDFKEYSLKGGAPYANTGEYLKAQGVTTSELPSSLRYDSIGAALTYTPPTIGEKAENLWNNTLGYDNVKKIVNETVDDLHTTLGLIADNIDNSVIGDIGRLINKKDGGGGGRSFAPNAMGGINRPGTLFYAGEAGPEFIGAMGSSSAVANTGQMVDAIYKAAYMGMSRALAENGGGLSGFEPATTDDLFIAMRKKASNYNKRTGASAFA